MESIFGMENMAREAAVKRMIQTYEKEIRDFARTSNQIRQSFPMRSAWYCPLLLYLGNAFIFIGKRLVTRYSVRTTARAQ